MSPSTSDPLNTEVEAKFGGGESNYRLILDWLTAKGFASDIRNPLHRLHIYFDSYGVLHQAGCRLRCVIAPGEWCRYDFKAPKVDLPGDVLELSIKQVCPMPMVDLIEVIKAKLPDSRPRQLLADIRATAGVVLVMTGTHYKSMMRREGLEIEVSWDVMVPLVSGAPFSEIELEFKAGKRNEFDACICDIEATLQLQRIYHSKYERALAQGDSLHANM